VFYQANLIKSATIELPNAAGPADPLWLSLGNFWAAISSQIRLILATVILSLLAAAIFLATATAQYTATTQILIDPSDLRVVDNGVTPNNQVSEVAVIQAESQVRVITSDNVLRRVIASEKLDEDPAFNPQPSALRNLLAKVLAPFGRVHAARRTDPTLTTLDKLRRSIRVKRAERTYVVDVTAMTDDPDKSVRIANALAQAYLADQTAARSEAARRASESLSARLSELRNRVRQAEDKVEEFKARNNIVDVNGLLVNEQQLREVNNQLSLARGRTAEAKSRFEQVQALQRSKADIGSFTEAVQSQTMAAMRVQYAEVTRREAELTASLGPRHPSVIEAHAQTQRLRGLIDQEIKRIADAAASDYERARASEESLTRSLEALKRDTISTNEARVALRDLDRDVKANRTVYEAFLVRSRETGEQERLDTRNVRVISTADVPLTRSWPPSSVLVALGAMFFGLSAGTGLALLRGTRGRPDRPPSSAPEEQSGYPQLAALPDIACGHPFSAFDDPKSQPAGEIRALHDALRGDRKQWSGQSILLISPHDGGETAAVALNIALVAAASQNVLLIDADRRGRAADALAPDRGRGGIIDVVSGQKSLSEVVVRDPRTSINVLPFGGGETDGYGDIDGDRIKSALKDTKQFDLVIVVEASDRENSAALGIAALVDEIVLITKTDTRQHDVDRAIAALGVNAQKVRGTVLMGAKSRLAPRHEPSGVLPL
jgi:polysaccharide biosynthesis transport protein